MKRRRLSLIILVLALLLCGCRTRTTPGTQAETQETVSAEQAETSVLPANTVQGDASEQGSQPAPEPTPEPTPEPEQGLSSDPNAPTLHDEASERREYASDASGELTPGAEAPIFTPTEDAETVTGAEAEGGAKISVETETEELTVTEILPADDSEQTGADSSGETADSVQTYYLTLLSDRLGSLFECKRLYVYWECTEDHRTVFKTSREHEIIVGAGAYDVSAKLSEENLTVDDGWVVRKNPDVVVKVLGEGTLDLPFAAAQCSGLAARADWSGISAVQTGRILVLSQSLLDTQAGRISAMVYLAKLMYPDQLGDLDADEAMRALTEEADGAAWAGQYAYMM